MRLLAFDCATSACSAAVWADGRILARRFEAMQRGQAEVLVPMLQSVMAEAGLGFRDLDLLATTVGPGAFTGLRIGLSTARAMALAAALPLLGLTTLETVAAAQDPVARGDRPLLVALETRRADVYVQLFGADLRPLTAPAARLPEAVAALLPEGEIALAGDAAPAVLAACGGTASLLPLAGPDLPDAAVLAGLAAVRAAARPPTPDDPPPSPLYLRPPDVTLPPRGPGGAADRRR